MKKISRETAIQRKLDRFFTGNPCRNGHIDERSVYTLRCVACNMAQGRKRGRHPRPQLRGNCEFCGKEFVTTIPTRRFCNSSCRDKFAHLRVKQCTECGSQFSSATRGHGNKTCCDDCREIRRRRIGNEFYHSHKEKWKCKTSLYASQYPERKAEYQRRRKARIRQALLTLKLLEEGNGVH